MSEDNVKYDRAMNHRERYEQHSKIPGIIQPSPEDTLEALTDRLLQALYKPTQEDMMFRGDKDRCSLYGLTEEPINWGSLKCVEVRKYADGAYKITIDEAAPNDCPNLCAYIQKHLTAWGWTVEVETEW